MTRINVIPVEQLTNEHLAAEWRELPRIFQYAYNASQSSKPWTHKQPKEYKLGEGHMTFFYDKLGFLADRHLQLTKERLDRGYKTSYTDTLRDKWQNLIPASYWQSYVPTQEAIALNVERINKRLSGDKS